MNKSGDRKIENSGVARPLPPQDSEIFLRRIRRQNADANTSATVLAVSERTSSDGFKKLTREYELAEYLDRAWALQPLELVHENGRTTLILEDPGGDLLSQLLDTPMEVDRFLRLAIGITAAISKMHQRDLVHKDIQPIPIFFSIPLLSKSG